MRCGKLDATEGPQLIAAAPFHIKIRMIVSYNFYYARPGNAAAVLQQRIRASDVRAQLGLPRGRTISKIEGGDVEGRDDFPNVIWRLDFAGMTGQDADMKIRAASPEFEAIRHGMRQLYRRFERPLYTPCGNSDIPPLVIEPQQSMLLYGVYCDGSVSAAVRAVLGTDQVVEFMSGGTDVPCMLCETGSAGLPHAMLENLQRLPVRVMRSLWQIEDCG